MKITCGTDIVDIKRIKRAIEKNPSFADRIFTVAEQEYCMDKNAGKYQSLAARFAAKEAVSKAMGTGMGKKASPLEIEIVNDSLGKPIVSLKGKTHTTFLEIAGDEIDISLSHSHDYAVAFAVITYKGKSNE